MHVEVTINDLPSATKVYVGWAPLAAKIRVAEPDGAPGPVDVRLRNQKPRAGGQVVFGPTADATGEPELRLSLPADGTPVDFFVAGRFGRPSRVDGDAVIQVNAADSPRVLSRTRLMVRIRKDAAGLSVAERNRFIAALATLNDAGMGRFSDFRNVHTNAGSPEAHGNAGFLPWHRAYLLDLERELQAIDPSVSLPYWRFDRPARRLFTRSFIGVPDASTGTLQFLASNPLQFWATDGVAGIVRRPLFDAAASAPPVFDEATTLALGGASHLYRRFLRMEIGPHGDAHTSFNGFISSIGTAARDPLFFLLHANVDRLWAKWQWFNLRFDVTSTDSYAFLGSAGAPGSTRIGHNLGDTMWPWNGIMGAPRPPTAPGGDFPPSLLASAPDRIPTVRQMIDYQGVMTPASRLGFDYDDVPFEAQ